MSANGIHNNWEVQKAKLKQKYALLTDDDLLLVEGKKEEMLGKIQVILGKTKEELQNIIAAL